MSREIERGEEGRSNGAGLGAGGLGAEGRLAFTGLGEGGVGAGERSAGAGLGAMGLGAEGGSAFAGLGAGERFAGAGLALPIMLLVWAGTSCAGCGSGSGGGGDTVELLEADDSGGDVLLDVATGDLAAGDSWEVDGEVDGEGEGSLHFTVMTFNVGTTDFLPHDNDEKRGEGDGYTSAHAAENAKKYSNNLAWMPAERALTELLAERKVDVVLFQELYFDPWCEEVEVDPAMEFVCNDYSAERAWQVRRLLGDEYHIACAAGHRDNCVGVRRSFGEIEGCNGDDVCMSGVVGFPPAGGCTKGERVGTVAVRVMGGPVIHVVNAHVVSGMSEEDMACRKSHFEQIFVDRGDGVPAANGRYNIVGGDMNTDPFLMADGDPSARFWNLHVGAGKEFHYVSSGDASGPPTLSSLFHIDHIISDSATGSCVVAGQSAGVAHVMETSYWDHRPVICDVELLYASSKQ